MRVQGLRASKRKSANDRGKEERAEDQNKPYLKGEGPPPVPPSAFAGLQLLAGGVIGPDRCRHRL